MLRYIDALLVVVPVGKQERGFGRWCCDLRPGGSDEERWPISIG